MKIHIQCLCFYCDFLMYRFADLCPVNLEQTLFLLLTLKSVMSGTLSLSCESSGEDASCQISHAE